MVSAIVDKFVTHSDIESSDREENFSTRVISETNPQVSERAKESSLEKRRNPNILLAVFFDTRKELVNKNKL